MDNYDYAKIDREALRQIEEEAEEARMSNHEWRYDRWVKSPIPIDCNSRSVNEALYDNNAIWDWNPRIENIDTSPEPLELIPIGEYDGGDLLPGAMILDDSYIVYVQVPNPEYDCEVIIN